MGKTPGKWIKNLFSGKKSSKSSPSSKRNIWKPPSNQDALVPSEASVPNIPVDSSLIFPPTSGVNAAKEVHSEMVVVSRSSNDGNSLSAGVEETDAQAVVDSGSLDDVEKIRLAQAAIKAQAAFRGYQARRAFQTLKGVIQLQALIRGHLVRRQAVSTLYCVNGIVKVQALARGHKVRHSDIGIAVLKICKDTKCSNSIGGEVTTTRAEKLSKSVFVQKLLASSSSTVPINLNIDPGEPNFAWKWLEHWTRSHFWAPLPKSKKKLDLKSDEKSASCQSHENKKGKVKRNAQKASGVKVDDGSISESDKLKQHLKKVSSRPMHSSQEHSQKEIKNNIKKTSVQSVSSGSEVATEKTKHVAGLGPAVADVSEHGPSVSAEKVKNLGVSKSNQSDLEKSLGQQAEDDHGESHDNPIADLQTSVNNGREEVKQGASEDLNSDVNPKNSLRRASLPANLNNQDNGAHNTPRLPSYMAPTESAKAKLRAQGSPRFANDLVDKNGITRRLSLSSSLNGKLGSFSPRAERLLTMSSRGLIRTDRSLQSSRDGTDKLIQPRWRK